MSCLFLSRNSEDRNAWTGRQGGGAIGNQWSSFYVSNSSCAHNQPNSIWTDGAQTAVSQLPDSSRTWPM
jgi:hypothetical protein